MKKISQILINKKFYPGKKLNLNKESVACIFRKVIQDEYGKKGLENIQLKDFKNGKIIVKLKSSVWANEIWINRVFILKKINKQLGAEKTEKIKDIKIEN